jgi:hypothetical protein
MNDILNAHPAPLNTKKTIASSLRPRLAMTPFSVIASARRARGNLSFVTTKRLLRFARNDGGIIGLAMTKKYAAKHPKKQNPLVAGFVQRGIAF